MAARKPGKPRMRPRGDAYVRVRDATLQTCSVVPRGISKSGQCPAWSVAISDNGSIPEGGALVSTAQYVVEVIGVFEAGEATIARMTVNADYSLPRARVLATGTAPGVKWYRLSAMAIGATEREGEGGNVSGQVDARFFLNATDLCGSPNWRAAGVVDS